MADILIVDDNAGIRELITESLNAYGYETDQAASGQDALRACSIRTYRIIFLDLLLDKEDGCEVARMIRRLPHCNKDPYIIALTGFGSRPAEELNGCGIDMLLGKPQMTQTLVDVIQKVLANQPE